MSRIYFHSPTRDAELRGSERAWLAGLADDLAVGMLALHHTDRVQRLIGLAAPDHYITRHAQDHPNGMPLATAYRLAFLHDHSHTAPIIQHRGHRIDAFDVVLNTACLLGNDQVKLAARLHSQCEIHAWVDGPNRTWLADIMQAGLDHGIYRRGLPYPADPGHGRPEPVSVSQGWEDVITLLRERDDEPVVTSFSVTDQFPTSSVGDWMPPWPEDVPKDWRELTEEQQAQRRERQDAWYELDSAEQWRISMDGLRSSPGGMELRPDDWAGFRFGSGVTALDLLAHDWEDRLDRALISDTEED
ncbi:hypothetical protein WB388_08730 [Streptomyces brasiliscabiei]|uniref:Uncharacterized protein n=1 Tax=Streptomyces brasiliscabiei TaxID=2736302 RepID=A0ABU8GCB8_9ACTN